MAQGRCIELALALLVTFGLVSITTACSENTSTTLQVAVYTSVDQNYAEPVFKAFEKRTGITVKAVYDVEAAKTTGLVKRLIAESAHPQADVFWSGEPLQTINLEAYSVLASYRPTSLRPGHKQDSKAHWTMFGGRARVFIINTSRLTPPYWPKSIFDLGTDKWPAERTAVAYPLFGTSATHAAALYFTLGQDRARRFYDRLLKKKVRIVDGNAVVRDLVVAGTADSGLTDTDDACGAIRRGNASIAVVFPDQGAADIGTLVIPNTVALIAGGPNSKSGKVFIDYLLSKSVADKLAEAGWFHINGTQVIAQRECGLPATVKLMEVDFAALSLIMDNVMMDLRNRILR